MTTDIATLEQQASDFTTEATALAVIDTSTFERAGEVLKAIAVYIRRVGEVLDPMVEAAFKSHKVAVAQRDLLLRPAQGAKQVLGQRMSTWNEEQARLRREAEEAAQRERERLEREARERAAAETRRLQEEAETRRLEEAATMEAAGDSAGAERLISEPVAAPVVVLPAPVFAPRPMVAAPPKVQGVSFSPTWKAEVTDLMALVRAVAEGKQPLGLLQANEVALNKMAGALKGTMQIPGVKAVPGQKTSVRTSSP